MKHAKIIKFFAPFILAVLMISGCMPISKKLRNEAVNVAIPMAAENPDGYQGDVVVWGGKIIKTRNLNAGTEIYILGIPLDYMERPKDEVTTEGRFIAKTSDYLDPVIYTAGKTITVAGSLDGVETHKIGELDYVYPVVKISELHLWQPEVTYVYPDWYYRGYWGPYWYGSPYFYGGPFYYRHPRFHEGFGRGEFREHGEEGEHMGHGEHGGGMDHDRH